MAGLVIREATVEDVPACMPAARTFHEASPYRDLAFDEARTAQFLAGLISTGKAWLALDGERIVGGLGGCLVRPYFSMGLIAQEMFWFMAASARGGMTAGLLLRKFEAWAQAEKADGLSLSAFAGSRADECLSRIGFIAGETVWWKAL